MTVNGEDSISERKKQQQPTVLWREHAARRGDTFSHSILNI